MYVALCGVGINKYNCALWYGGKYYACIWFQVIQSIFNLLLKPQRFWLQFIFQMQFY